MEEQSKHQSVLAKEVIELLSPLKDKTILDATFGGGGHSRLFLQCQLGRGKVFAIDRDDSCDKFAQVLLKKYPKQFDFRVMSYDQVELIGKKFDRALMDLGLSTDQLESNRGFSYLKDEYLDMRFDSTKGIDASEWLNRASLKELQEVFSRYAQDRHSKNLAAKIIRRRAIKPLKTTLEFVEVVGTDNPKVLSPIFQAIRIKINDELNRLEKGLEAIDRVLKIGGLLAVISFHSLEDRIVKNFFKNKKYKMVTKKPVRPTFLETSRNPRSRSAILRVGEKTDGS